MWMNYLIVSSQTHIHSSLLCSAQKITEDGKFQRVMKKGINNDNACGWMSLDQNNFPVRESAFYARQEGNMEFFVCVQKKDAFDEFRA